MTAALPCSCGETRPHVVMERRTADGIGVCLWDDGAVTGILGFRLSGVPVRRPRTADGVALARTAGRLLLHEVCLYDVDELGALYAAAEKAARLDGEAGTMRRLYREGARVRPALVWSVLHADRDGKPVERVAWLPRMRWPGLVVWDYCGGPGSARGRYHLMRRIRPDGRPGAEDVFEETGSTFRRLEDLWAHLETQGVTYVEESA